MNDLRNINSDLFSFSNDNFTNFLLYRNQKYDGKTNHFFSFSNDNFTNFLLYRNQKYDGKTNQIIFFHLAMTILRISYYTVTRNMMVKQIKLF